MNGLKALLHWIPMGRSGGFRFALFPGADELGYEKRKLPKKMYQKRKVRLNISKISRKANR